MIKKRVVFFLFLLSIMSCQENVLANFDIYIESTNKFDKQHYDLHKITILKDNKAFKILESGDHAPSLDNNIKLDSILKGKYTFVYTNLFGEEIRKEETVKESKRYRISINPDSLIRKNKDLLFENLKNNEVKFVFKSIGCFHFEKDSIILKNVGGDYFIQGKKGLKKINKKVLGYFINIENQIRNIPTDGGCTTRDTFIFQYEGRSDTIYDKTCDFNIPGKISDYLKQNNI
ncbi:hypothetical protein [Chryseobacterium defluvii]|uniref:Lipoprotein n=1 Tax=Chryseobacterium defluvii TaxID=160396 RepID=A0A495SMY0_9FLAO|nr:hypothetical protein [Chryseobacterium defluvii]RKT01669.1 hypothetical protein BCF58_0892 [Chryseobacterium defluvii]